MEAIKMNKRVYLLKLKCLNLRAFSWDLSWILDICENCPDFRHRRSRGENGSNTYIHLWQAKTRQFYSLYSNQLKNLSKNWQYGIPNCHVCLGQIVRFENIWQFGFKTWNLTVGIWCLEKYKNKNCLIFKLNIFWSLEQTWTLSTTAEASAIVCSEYRL